MGELARRYSWPPFAEGNRAAQRHGAHSERAWRPIAAALIEELASNAPWTGKPAYIPTVSAWGRCEAQLVLIGDYLNQHGLLDGDEPRAATALQARIEGQCQALRSELGLSPAALARLIAVAERRGDSHQDPSRNELDQEIRAMVAEGRAVLSHIADEVGRLTAQAEGGGEGRGTDGNE